VLLGVLFSHSAKKGVNILASIMDCFSVLVRHHVRVVACADLYLFMKSCPCHLQAYIFKFFFPVKLPFSCHVGNCGR